jgi:hypothetical protein
MHIGSPKLPDRQRFIACHRDFLIVVTSMTAHLGSRILSVQWYILLGPSIKPAGSGGPPWI